MEAQALMALATDVMFSAIRDDYRTPARTFERYHERFGFGLDLAATRSNSLCGSYYFGRDHVTPEFRDALCVDWMAVARAMDLRPVGWLNPPYSMCADFVGKAAQQRLRGFCTVLLLPVRSDTRWWHAHAWDRTRQRPRPGVGLDFLSGRQQFSLDVTDAMRQAVRRHEQDAIRPKTSDDRKRLEKRISAAVGLPVLIVRAILDGQPEVVAGAPFPSVVVGFHPETRTT